MNHDNKIINALIGKINLCKELDSWGTELCLEQLNEILDLINRQQAELERLTKHTWIFLHTGDEEKAYQECGLTDEDNAMLGYIGKIELAEQEGDAE